MPADTTPPASRRPPARRENALSDTTRKTAVKTLPHDILPAAPSAAPPAAPSDIAAVGTDFWDQVRLAYTDGREPIARLCDRFDITPAELRDRRLAEGWPTRPSPIRPRRQSEPSPATSTQCAAAPTPAPSADPATQSPRKHRADRLRRFYATIDGDLAKLEALLKADDLTPSDAERLIRSLASIIQSYERVLDLDPAARSRDPRPSRSGAASPSGNSGHSKSHRAAGSSSNANASDTPGPADAERLRSEIADRIERLMDKGNVARNPDEPAP